MHSLETLLSAPPSVRRKSETGLLIPQITTFADTQSAYDLHPGFKVICSNNILHIFDKILFACVSFTLFDRKLQLPAVDIHSYIPCASCYKLLD